MFGTSRLIEQALLGGHKWSSFSPEIKENVRHRVDFGVRIRS
jgi:hypothetical protein